MHADSYQMDEEKLGNKSFRSKSSPVNRNNEITVNDAKATSKTADEANNCNKGLNNSPALDTDNLTSNKNPSDEKTTIKTTGERAKQRACRQENTKKAMGAAKIERNSTRSSTPVTRHDNIEDDSGGNISSRKTPEERARERAEHLEKIEKAREERQKSVMSSKSSSNKDVFEPKRHARVKSLEERARDRAEHAEKVKRSMEAKRQRWKESEPDLNRPSSRPSLLLLDLPLCCGADGTLLKLCLGISRHPPRSALILSRG